MTNTSPVRSFNKYISLIFITLLLLGIGLLFYEKKDEATLAFSVHFEHIPADLIAVHNTPPMLEVRLKGPARILKDLKNDSQLSYKIDLSTANPGTMLIKISPEMIKLPRRVSVLGIDPASFSMTIEKRTEKMVPVVPDLKKDPAPGYSICRVVATPSMVRLTGPASVLEEISAVRTTPIDVSGLTETIMKKVALNLNHNPHVRTIGGNLAEVEIVVNEKVVEKRFNIAIRAKDSNFRHVITPDRIEILLRGPVNTLKKLDQENGIQVYVDLGGLKPGTYVRRAVIKPPLNIMLIEANPEVFTVKLFK